MAFEELTVNGVLLKIANRYHYTMESIRNRYPCKIISVENLSDFSKKSIIRYQAAVKLNVCSSPVKNILDDPLLIEKFHPTDGVRLGFLSFGELILKDGISIEEAKELYLKLISKMFDQ